MCHIAVVGAGITGVTTAYELALLGYHVTVIDKHLYPAMETSFANGGAAFSLQCRGLESKSYSA